MGLIKKRKILAKSKTVPSRAPGYDKLLARVRGILLEGQRRIDAERVRTYWEAGRLIDEHILGRGRGERGKEVILRLAADLRVDDTLLNRCVRFARTYPSLGKSAGWQKFSWSHYRELITVADDRERLKLEKAAVKNEWSADELAVRIKEESSRIRDAVPPADQRPDQTRLIVPLRGKLYTYRLVERPNLSPGVESGLLVDLGFGIFHEVESRLLAAFAKDQIVESIPREDAYKFAKSDRAAADLFTYAAFVEKVIDGDTVKVRFDLGFNVWTRQTLRLRGLDCPEVGTKDGDEARSFVRSRLKEFQRIIVRSSRSDKYDRYLADVYVPAGKEPDEATDIYLNNLLLETGRAWRMD